MSAMQTNDNKRKDANQTRNQVELEMKKMEIGKPEVSQSDRKSTSERERVSGKVRRYQVTNKAASIK
jgi:hypothetical protein